MRPDFNSWEHRRQAAIDKGLPWEDDRGQIRTGPAPVTPSSLVQQPRGPVPPPGPGPDPTGQPEQQSSRPIHSEPEPAPPEDIRELREAAGLPLGLLDLGEGESVP